MKLLSFICEEIIACYIFHHGGKYRARALRRLTSNYQVTEIQISSIFWFKLHCYNSVKETGTSHYVKISCRDKCAAHGSKYIISCRWIVVRNNVTSRNTSCLFSKRYEKFYICLSNSKKTIICRLACTVYTVKPRIKEPLFFVSGWSGSYIIYLFIYLTSPGKITRMTCIQYKYKNYTSYEWRGHHNS
jgi:hypothetical protein